MESILVTILLLATHAAVGTASEDPCQPASFASEIISYCVNRTSISSCCESVIASVDIEGTGTAPCLCRVAAEPQLIVARLTTDDLLAMFGLCRALAPGGPPLEAACEGLADSPLRTELTQNSTAIGTGRQQSEHDSTIEWLQGEIVVGTTCNAQRLAFELKAFCSSGEVSGSCCKAVMTSIDIDNSAETPCICLVVDQWEFLNSGLGLNDIIGLYDECMGRQGIHQLFSDIC